LGANKRAYDPRVPRAGRRRARSDCSGADGHEGASQTGVSPRCQAARQDGPR